MTDHDVGMALGETIKRMAKLLADTEYVAPEQVHAIVARVEQAIVLWDAELSNLGYVPRRVSQQRKPDAAASDRDTLLRQLAEMRQKLDDTRGDNGRLADALEQARKAQTDRLHLVVVDGYEWELDSLWGDRDTATARARELIAALVKKSGLKVDAERVQVVTVKLNAADPDETWVNGSDLIASDPPEHPPCCSVLLPNEDERGGVPVNSAILSMARSELEADDQRRRAVNAMHGHDLVVANKTEPVMCDPMRHPYDVCQCGAGKVRGHQKECTRCSVCERLSHPPF